MKLKTLLILAGSLAISALSAQTSIKVDKVIDGDTFTSNGKNYRIAEIDAPELTQPRGVTSKRHLTNLILYKKVRIVPIAKDKWQRTIVKVWDGERYIAAMMVSSGNAWWYSKYSNNMHLKFLQEQARKKRKGFWAFQNPVYPPIYRKGHGK